MFLLKICKPVRGGDIVSVGRLNLNDVMATVLTCVGLHVLSDVLLKAHGGGHLLPGPPGGLGLGDVHGKELPSIVSCCILRVSI